MAEEGTNLWDCGDCGTQAIAAGLGYCPNCRKEREVPAVNRFGQSTVYGQPNEAQRNAMNHPIGLSPPSADDTEVLAKTEAAKELVDEGFDPADVKAAVGLPTGGQMADPPEPETSTTPETASPAESDPIAQATEKASQAKEAFSSGDKTGALALLDEAIALDPSRTEKWTKLKDQVIGSGETW